MSHKLCTWHHSSQIGWYSTDLSPPTRHDRAGLAKIGITLAAAAKEQNGEDLEEEERAALAARREETARGKRRRVIACGHALSAH